jgi:hypothetical protein
VLADVATAKVSERLRALLAFIERMNGDSAGITQADIDAVKALGWSDDALYDAITVCALFNFYNKWIDATGVGDLPAATYEANGARMAAAGYGEGE